jgi:hypothetical protein
MSTAIVVHYTGATRQSRSVAASLVADMVDEGHRVIVADISNFTTINQDFPPGWLVRFLGHRVFPEAFKIIVANSGAEHRVLFPTDKLSRRIIPQEALEDITIAVESELLTYFRRETLDPPTPYIRWLRSAITRQTEATYAALATLFASEAPDLVLVPNGRTSRQKAARKAAENAGASVEFYEMGRAQANHYYRGTTQPHDRLASQAEVTKVTKHLSARKIRALAESWQQERMSPSSNTNSFSAGWDAPSEPQKTSEKKTAPQKAVFFSSSADEFMAFGPMWNIDSWASQFEAFDLMMSHFENQGVALEMRLHPNLTGKSRSYFLETVRSVKELAARHPGLTVHWHNSPINSYELIHSADYVVAERSTIALEANLVGKPVWINQAAQWDLIADIRQVLSPTEITLEVMTPWEIDSTPAQRFVAYWMVQERPLRFSWKDWATWNPDTAPLALRAALLFVKNPWRHRAHLLALEWAKIQNSFFRG